MGRATRRHWPLLLLRQRLSRERAAAEAWVAGTGGDRWAERRADAVLGRIAARMGGVLTPAGPSAAYRAWRRHTQPGWGNRTHRAHPVPV